MKSTVLSKNFLFYISKIKIAPSEFEQCLSSNGNCVPDYVEVTSMVNGSVQGAQAFPRRVTLDLGYYQKEQSIQDILTAKLIFSDFTDINTDLDKI